MIYTPWPHQAEGIDRGVEFFKSPKPGNEIQIHPTGSGKSVVIANMIKELGGEPVLILQPSKEILTQNIEKYRSYDFEASIYSASKGEKVISDATFATIGSIVKKPDLFQHFKYMLVDECHLCNPKGGMYDDFIRAIGPHKIMGLTATPYRLSTSSYGAMLKFITRTRPKIFQGVNFLVQNKTLFDQGYLAPLVYYDLAPNLKFAREKILSNSTGAEFDEKSMQEYMAALNFMPFLIKTLTRLLEIRKSICTFVQFTDQAYEVASYFGDQVCVITAKTPDKVRDRLFDDWKSGKIKMLVNVGVATTGVDYPGLDTVVLANPTKSLARHYQKVGRGMRRCEGKESGWVVDLCGNTSYFGKIEDLHVGYDQKGLWQVSTNGKPLTNVILTEDLTK